MENKTFWEIVLLPLTVAAIGVLGTVVVSTTQVESAKALAESQQKIKIIEIFSDKITASDEKERALAINVLATLDSDLGQKIASAIADSNLDIKADIDGMETSLASEVIAKIENEKKADTNDNSKYLIGIYGFDVSTEAFQKLSSTIKGSGYTVITDRLLTSEPDWMAKSPTILYYSNDSENKAKEIMTDLSEKTGKRFSVKRGAGLGVPKGQESTRLFIHYRP